MCGIVHRPTRRKFFEQNSFLYPNLPSKIVSSISGICEDVHIPELATSIVLGMANFLVGKEFVLETLPFALYSDGKRIVSKETLLAEVDVMHLAMAGSVRYLINQELFQYGMKLEMGHCCDIQMHSLAHEEQAMILSHDVNVYRADKLRLMSDRSQVLASDCYFAELCEKLSPNSVKFLYLLSGEKIFM